MRCAIVFLLGWFLGNVAGGQMQKAEQRKRSRGWALVRFVPLSAIPYGRDRLWFVGVEKRDAGTALGSAHGIPPRQFVSAEIAELECDRLNAWAQDVTV